MELLSSIGDMSAAEGFPIVLLSGLQAFGALALIVAVLIVMDRVFKKKHPEWKDENNDSTDSDNNIEISEKEDNAE